MRLKNNLYGVDYNPVTVNKKNNTILFVDGTITDLYTSEKELVSRLAELQNDDCIINIKPFVAELQKQEYKLEFK